MLVENRDTTPAELKTLTLARTELKQTRNLQIDVLRGVAVIGVLFAHIVIFRPHDAWGMKLFNRGWVGVDLFFVLSGFLISGLLFSEYQRSGRINFGRFAVRRAMKIYPPFYLLIAFTLVRRFADGGMENPWKILTPLFHDIFFLQSYLQGSYGHFWSLAVEEHFYILLPISLYIGIRAARDRSNPFNWIPVGFLVLAGTVLAARVVTWLLIQPFDYFVHGFPTHLRIDSLMFGVLLSYLAHFHAERLQRFVARNYWPVLVGSVALIMAALAVEKKLLCTVGFTALYLGFGGILMVMLRTEMPTDGWLRVALSRTAAIGKHSYSIYLWHIPLLVMLQSAGFLNAAPRSMAIYLAVSIVVGIGLSMLIDIPVLRLRDRLWPRAERSR